MNMILWVYRIFRKKAKNVRLNEERFLDWILVKYLKYFYLPVKILDSVVLWAKTGRNSTVRMREIIQIYIEKFL